MTATTRSTPANAVDGRTARRDRNRLAVLDAVLELFSEGDPDPSPDDVARRSGVSLRSVYRYVEDRDDLLRAAIARHLELVGPLFTIPDLGRGDLEHRIERLATARLTLYEAIATTHRVSRVRASSNPVIRAQLDVGRRALREQVEQQFAPELRRLTGARRRDIAAAVDALTQMENLDYFRVHCGHSPRVARGILVEALRRLLGAGEKP